MHKPACCTLSQKQCVHNAADGSNDNRRIQKVLRSRGFTALLACLVAAAAAGVWAVRTVQDELKKSYDDLTTPQEEPAPEPQLTLDPQEDDVWQRPVTVPQNLRQMY